MTIRAFALTYFATLHTVRVFIFNTLPIRLVEMKRIDNDDSNKRLAWKRERVAY